MSNRHQTTDEQRAKTITIDPRHISKKDLHTAYEILSLPAKDYTKWFTTKSVLDYQLSYATQFIDLKTMVRDDPHSRRILMTGPPGACWCLTHLLSLPSGGYQVIAFYRSLEDQHMMIDLALQTVIGQNIAKDVREVTLIASSFHRYLSP